MTTHPTTKGSTVAKAKTVAAIDLREGMEVTVSKARSDYAVVEDVQSEWAHANNKLRVRIILIDGREFAVAPDRKIQVVS